MLDTIIKFSSKETFEKLRNICIDNDLKMEAMDSIGTFVVSEKPKRIDVDCGWTQKSIGKSKNQVVFCFDKKGTNDNVFNGEYDTVLISKVTKFLASQLESYLNNETGKEDSNG